MVSKFLNQRVGHPPDVGTPFYLFKNSTIDRVHYRSRFGIRYVAEGCVKTNVNGRIFRIRPGEILLVEGDSMVWTEAEAITGFSLFLSPDQIDEVCHLVRWVASPQALFERSQVLSTPLANSFFPNLIGYFKEAIKTDFSGEVSAIGMEEVLGKVVVDMHGIHSRLSLLNKKKMSTRLDNLRKLESARAILDSEAAGKFRLDSLAKRIFMSKFFFIRHFKQVYGMTPQHYFIDRKLAFAKFLLGSGATVKEASIQCGYPDVYSFSKQFKLYVGYPPSAQKAMVLGT